MWRFRVLLELVDENDGDSFVEKRAFFAQRELTSAGFLRGGKQVLVKRFKLVLKD